MTRNQPTIRILSWRGAWGRALEEALCRPFTEATGIAVEAVHHVGLHLPPALTTALAWGGPPPVDIVWSNTAPALQAAARGWTRPLDRLPGLNGLRAQARPAGFDHWPLVQVYRVPYVLVYRRELYPDGPPDSWQTLADPRHRGRVMMYPGGNGFYPVAQVLGGGDPGDLPHAMKPCWNTVARLARQFGTPDYSIGLEGALARGDIHLCYRALPNALAFQQADPGVDWTVPREGVADTTDALWLPRGLDRQAARRARRFVAYALSAPVQERWCRALGALPMHREARVPELFRHHPRLPDHADDRRGVLYVPEAVKAVHEPLWERRFRRLIIAGPHPESIETKGEMGQQHLPSSIRTVPRVPAFAACPGPVRQPWSNA